MNCRAAAKEGGLGRLFAPRKSNILRDPGETRFLRAQKQLDELHIAITATEEE